MYTLTTINKNGLEFLELENLKNGSKASISLNEGASLQVLSLNKVQVIEDLHPLTYKETYASSILFPFVNRIRDGKYKFNGEAYELDCNDKEKNNALHGLVYNKRFECVEKELTTDFVSVTLQYKDKGETEGFPFRFTLSLTYVLSKNGIQLTVSVLNKDQRSFPFSLGWHPYFKSADLYKSSLNFKASKQFQFDDQQITSDCADFEKEMPFQIKDKQLDDAFLLNEDEIVFLTPEYLLKIQSSYSNGFLQLYTPNKQNVLAIEPMTGVSDSFNNLRGLKVLMPDENFTTSWNISIEKLSNHNTNYLTNKLCNS